MFFLAPDHRWCPVAGGSIKEEEEETEIVRNSKVLVDFKVRTWSPKKSHVAAEASASIQASI